MTLSFVCEVEVYSKALDLLLRRLGLLQWLEMLVAQQTYDHPKSNSVTFCRVYSVPLAQTDKLGHLMPRSHCGVSLPVSPRSSWKWRNIMRTMRSIIWMGTNSMERQEAGSVPICIAPFNTNMVKRGRGVKPGQNGSRTGLTGGVCNSIRVILAWA